jgi:hypothetical protein
MTTYRASVERRDGINVTVTISLPDGTPDPAEFSELAQMGLVQADKIVARCVESRDSKNLPF